MKLVSIIFILVFSLSAFGQNKSTNAKPEKPKDLENLAISAGFTFKPFDASVSKLPPNYLGHNIAFITIRTYAAYKGIIKDEFETNEEFLKRKEAARLKPYSKDGSLNKNSLFAFSVASPQLSSTYNADKGLFDVSVYFGSSYSDNEAAAIFLENEQLGQPYEAQNAFGVKSVVTRVKVVSYELSFIHPNFKYSLNNYRLIAEVPVRREQAITDKPYLSMLAIGNLFLDSNNPVYFGETQTSKPTISNPTEFARSSFTLRMKPKEIWFYNKKTGEIYSKQKLRN